MGLFIQRELRINTNQSLAGSISISCNVQRWLTVVIRSWDVGTYSNLSQQDILTL